MNRKISVPLLLLFVNLAFPQEIIEREFEVPSGKRLKADLKTGGSLTVTGWDEERVNVVAQLDGIDCDDVKIDIREIFSGVSVDAGVTRRRFDLDCDLEFDIHVPMRFDLEVETMGEKSPLTTWTAGSKARPWGVS